MWLTRLSIRNPYLTTVLMMLLLVLGFSVFKKIAIEENPDVSFPFAVVSTPYTGASPEVIEQEISKPVESELATLNGLKSIRSNSYEGTSVVIVEFTLDTDINQAIQEVREKVSRIQRGFRDEIGNPAVFRYDPNSSNPMLTMAVASDQTDMRSLTTWVDQILTKEIQTVDGVGTVDVIGGSKREVRVEIDPVRLRAMSLSVNDVYETIRVANQALPAGKITTGSRELSLRIEGKIRQVSEFANLIITWKDGRSIKVSDVARVYDSEADRRSVSFINGKPSIGLLIYETRGANVVATAEKIREKLIELEDDLPNGTEIVFTADKSKSIRNSVKNVQSTLFEGAVLTVLVVFLFLGSWRSTVITGLTLPIALVGTFFAMSLFGFTFNNMTLLALSLSIGLLIDDAIVVRENIVRHANMGKGHYQAALDGTDEIGLAVLATTLTIVAIFLPVGFMDGIIGRFFYPFAVTVCIAVLISMFVSFTLDPMLSSIWPDPHHHGDHHQGPLGRLLDWFETILDHLSGAYVRLIRWALQYRKTVLLITLGLLLASFACVTLLKKEFIPEADTGSFRVSFRTPDGSDLEYTREKSDEIAEIIRQHTPEMKYLQTNIGGGGRRSRSTNSVRMTVEVGSKRTRDRSINDIITELRQNIQPVSGIYLESIRPPSSGRGGVNKPINVSIQGRDVEQLERLANEFIKRMEQKSDFFVDIESSFEKQNPAISLLVDREKTSFLGLDLPTLGNTVDTYFNGRSPSSWEAPDGYNYDVKVIVPEALRTRETLNALTIPSRRADQSNVPITSIADFEYTNAPKEIIREDQERRVSISANLKDKDVDLGKASSKVDEIKDQFPMPPSYSFGELQGDQKFMGEAAQEAIKAVILGSVFVYMVLVAQFRSFTLPISVMVALPLSFIGVFIGLLLMRSSLNLFSMIGIVMLMGLAAKNGILLVDFINQARRQGAQRFESIIDATKTRFRPIMMTTIAMIFGMLPLALGLGEGAETRSSMAHAVIGGLISSTMLTLVVLPVVYTYMDDLRGWLRRLIGMPDAYAKKEWEMDPTEPQPNSSNTNR